MDTQKHITQNDMAVFLSESQQYVSRLLNNKIIPRLSKLEKFSRLTHTDLSFWLKSSCSEKEQAIKKAMLKQEEAA